MIATGAMAAATTPAAVRPSVHCHRPFLLHIFPSPHRGSVSNLAAGWVMHQGRLELAIMDFFVVKNKTKVYEYVMRKCRN